jgi:hypothetical protein
VPNGPGSPLTGERGDKFADAWAKCLDPRSAVGSQFRRPLVDRKGNTSRIPSCLADATKFEINCGASALKVLCAVADRSAKSTGVFHLILRLPFGVASIFDTCNTLTPECPQSDLGSQVGRRCGRWVCRECGDHSHWLDNSIKDPERAAEVETIDKRLLPPNWARRMPHLDGIATRWQRELFASQVKAGGSKGYV